MVVLLINMSAYGSKNTFLISAKPIDVVEQQVEKQVLSLLLGLRYKQIVPQNVDIKQIAPQNFDKNSSFHKFEIETLISTDLRLKCNETPFPLEGKDRYIYNIVRFTQPHPNWFLGAPSTPLIIISSKNFVQPLQPDFTYFDASEVVKEIFLTRRRSV